MARPSEIDSIMNAALLIGAGYAAYRFACAGKLGAQGTDLAGTLHPCAVVVPPPVTPTSPSTGGSNPITPPPVYPTPDPSPICTDLNCAV